jgi:hypothetical protein
VHAALGPKEYEPNGTKDQDGKASTDHKKQEHRRAALRLACLRWCFDNYAVLLNCHDSLRFSVPDRLGQRLVFSQFYRDHHPEAHLR